MALSFALITLLGLLFHKAFQKIKLPGLLGLLLLGIILGPYGFNLIDSTTLAISGDLRKIALIIILLRAGLGISRDNLNEVGSEALKMSVLPCMLEGTVITLFAMHWLAFPFLEAGMLGFIVAAVSPAVIVPAMLALMNQQKNINQRIPTLILAGASLDDVIAITILSSFISIFSGQSFHLAWQIASVPLSIINGLIVGGLVAKMLLWLFNAYDIRHTKKVLLLVGTGVLMTAAEDAFHERIPMAALLGVMFTGFLILERKPQVAKALSDKLSKVWIFAEILLFVMVGAAVNFSLALEAGWWGVLIIVCGLTARSLGVFLSVSREGYSFREIGFCIIAYLPKATVQAATGALPLAAGAIHGDQILALAVMSIIITAPLGAFGIQWGSQNLL
ncbi:cation:proton antiporter [Anoxynatronum sibiricum]|uniref:Cation:proton antiporter n=1 Tax=Anoxynatronum sibiricum TaxID=210623 RepID=A0ABU9VQB8_9CLOT